MLILLYAVKPITWHVVATYEYGLCLLFTPRIEAFIVKGVKTVIRVVIGAFIGNVAVYHAVFGYLDLFVVTDRGGKAIFTPPELCHVGVVGTLL